MQRIVAGIWLSKRSALRQPETGDARRIGFCVAGAAEMALEESGVVREVDQRFHERALATDRKGRTRWLLKTAGLTFKADIISETRSYHLEELGGQGKRWTGHGAGAAETFANSSSEPKSVACGSITRTPTRKRSIAGVAISSRHLLTIFLQRRTNHRSH